MFGEISFKAVVIGALREAAANEIRVALVSGIAPKIEGSRCARSSRAADGGSRLIFPTRRTLMPKSAIAATILETADVLLPTIRCSVSS
jgi:hypothetical protein